MIRLSSFIRSSKTKTDDLDLNRASDLEKEYYSRYRIARTDFETTVQSLNIHPSDKQRLLNGLYCATEAAKATALTGAYEHFLIKKPREYREYMSTGVRSWTSWLDEVFQEAVVKTNGSQQ